MANGPQSGLIICNDIQNYRWPTGMVRRMFARNLLFTIVPTSRHNAFQYFEIVVASASAPDVIKTETLGEPASTFLHSDMI